MRSSKHKDKRKREHKSTSKSSTSTQPAISDDNVPENFGFLYQIDVVKINFNKHQRRILSIGASEKKGNDIGRYWYPPIYKSHFIRRPGNLYRWTGYEASKRLSARPEGLAKPYQVASVFFQAKQDNFLAVFKDCTEDDIANEAHGWSQIGFHHLSKTYPYMSEVNIGGEKDLVAAPADQTSWMPQVLPMVYNYDKNPLLARPEGESEGLCGKLSLLIAMAAFSAPEEAAEHVVSTCFGWNGWEAHSYEVGIGRYQDRGVVVKIYLDPDANGIRSSHLKAFEGGKYGPIFDDFIPPATQPTPAYTHQPTGQFSSHNPATSTPRTLNTSYSFSIGDTTQYTSASGYPASTGNTAASGYSIADTTQYAPAPGYPASTGNTAASGYSIADTIQYAPAPGYPASTMIDQTTELYEAEDKKKENDEN